MCVGGGRASRRQQLDKRTGAWSSAHGCELFNNPCAQTRSARLDTMQRLEARRTQQIKQTEGQSKRGHRRASLGVPVPVQAEPHRSPLHEGALGQCSGSHPPKTPLQEDHDTWLAVGPVAGVHLRGSKSPRDRRIMESTTCANISAGCTTNEKRCSCGGGLPSAG